MGVFNSGFYSINRMRVCDPPPPTTPLHGTFRLDYEYDSLRPLDNYEYEHELDYEYDFLETFRFDYEYELDYEYDFLEIFRFDYEYELDYEYDFLETFR